MLAKELISYDIPSLKTSDTGGEALDIMDIFKVSHLPIVNHKIFLGLISEKNIQDLEKLDEPIGNHKLSLLSPNVYDDQHVYDVIGLVSKHKITVIPVLNRKNEYLGLITLTDLVDKISKVSSITEPGGIILLDLNINDYSVSEIAKIVESNDARILSIYLTSPGDSTKLEITLKINRTDLTTIIRSFERYGYIIKASYQENNNLDSVNENRYESFLKYLNP